MHRTAASPQVLLPAAVTAMALGLAGCTSPSAPSRTPTPSAPPSVRVEADTSVPSEAPPLGPDVACSNRMRCYLKNPRKLSDEQWKKQVLPAVPGATRPPAPEMRPWAYGVFGLGQGRTAARDQPSEAGAVVDDGYGILNHRVVFAFCRTAGADPHRSWYLVEPMTVDAPPQVWVPGAHLEPYGHNGRIPTC